jgi:hypothetical protein
MDRGDSFKGRQFTAEVILWAVRWYLMFPISYRDLELMLLDRGVEVDHTTIFRWIQAVGTSPPSLRREAISMSAARRSPPTPSTGRSAMSLKSAHCRQHTPSRPPPSVAAKRSARPRSQRGATPVLPPQEAWAQYRGRC